MNNGAEPTVDIECLKAPLCRNIRVDGVIGYVKGDEIVCAMFVEKAGMPKKFTHLLKEDGKLGPGRIEETKTVREVEVEVFISQRTAENMVKFLQEKLHELTSSSG